MENTSTQPGSERHPNARHGLNLRVLGCAAALALGVPCAQVRAAEAGSVVFAAGPVLIASPQGQASAAAAGRALAGGELLRTGANGRVQVRLRDGSYLSLSGSTDLRVDAYRYGGADPTASFTLFRGKARFMTGAIGRTRGGRFRVNTPVAAVDAFAGEFVATAGSGLELSVGAGRAVVYNEAGTLTVSRGQRAFVPARTAPPVLVGTIVPAPIVPQPR